MVTVTINRKYLSHSVLGTMVIDGLPFFTIEKPWLSNKPFESCIPEGEYICHPYSSEKFHDVWEVKGVPDRTHILIHKGNYVEDVEGCIAVGLSLAALDINNNIVNNDFSEITEDNKYMVKESKLAFDSLRKMLPGVFSLTIKSSDSN